MSKFKLDFSDERSATNRELVEEITSMSPLSAQAVEDLLPDPSDKEKLIQLIKLVNESTNELATLSEVQNNFNQLGGVLVRVFGALIKR